MTRALLALALALGAAGCSAVHVVPSPGFGSADYETRLAEIERLGAAQPAQVRLDDGRRLDDLYRVRVDGDSLRWDSYGRAGATPLANVCDVGFGDASRGGLGGIAAGGALVTAVLAVVAARSARSDGGLGGSLALGMMVLGGGLAILAPALVVTAAEDNPTLYHFKQCAS